jgi:RimJ/RimL family protein N-acetyltransferase
MDMQVMDIRPTTLEGRHVRLEPLAENHHAALAQVLDPTLLQWFTRPVTTAEELRGFIAAALEEQAQGRSLPFAIVDRVTGRAIGSTRFGNIDRANRRVEIGWTWIGRVWQRTAVNTEAKLLMLSHAFEAWGAIRVEFKTDSRNTQSRAALARLGATEEGYFRNHMITASGRLRHSVWFSIVDSEWPMVKRRLEARLAQA